MGNALDGIRQAVRVVIHGIDRPGVAGVLVADLADPVKRRVAQIDIAGSHVDPGSQGTRAIGEFACAHALEQIEILLDAAFAVG